MDTTQIAVILTGLVALGAIVITPVVNLVIDWFKWRRETAAARNKNVEEATKNFLAAIAEY